MATRSVLLRREHRPGRATSRSAQNRQKKNDRQRAKDHGLRRLVVQESDERQRDGCEQSRLAYQAYRAGIWCPNDDLCHGGIGSRDVKKGRVSQREVAVGGCRIGSFSLGRVMPLRFWRQGGKSADRASLPPRPASRFRDEIRPAMRARVRIDEVDLSRHRSTPACGQYASWRNSECYPIRRSRRPQST
jgi:hypothetical protein